MKIGSHNTMSYLKPAKWWLWPFRFMATCQDLSWEEQIANGATLLDLRFAWENDEIYFAHGLMTYESGDEFINDMLERLDRIAKIKESKGEKLYVRVLCERPVDNDYFVLWCKHLDDTYKNIAFYGARDKKTWKELYSFDRGTPNAADKYSSCNYDTELATGWHLDDLWPRVYAFLFNKRWRKKYENEDLILMQDFIGKY